jgi:uncharacterized protein YdhG (YjbR/CyaY superfamily)
MNTSKNTTKQSTGFTEEEKAAMKTRAQELKAEARANKDRAEGERALLSAIAAMNESDRGIAKKIHEIINASAPTLTPKTWYGMPAYANKDGKIVCDFKPAQKFNTRYAMFEFQDAAKLDEGYMWPVGFALKELTTAEEARIRDLMKKAIAEK